MVWQRIPTMDTIFIIPAFLLILVLSAAHSTAQGTFYQFKFVLDVCHTEQYILDHNMVLQKKPVKIYKRK